MAIRNIRLVDDPILRKKAKPFIKFGEKTKQLAQDMFDTMDKANGIGLAANQIGILRRIFVIGIDEDQRYVFINPKIIERSKEEEFAYEGCLSIPNKQARVLRPTHIKVRAYDASGREFELEAEDLLARAICHENDHLDGILITDISDDIIDLREIDTQDNEAREG